MPASTTLAKARNAYEFDTQTEDFLTGVDQVTKAKTFEVASPEGMLVRVTRVPLAEGGTQLSVFINTEDMTIDHAENGEPEIQVLVNDASLYDREPGKERKYEQVYVVPRDDDADPSPVIFENRNDAVGFAASFDPDGPPKPVYDVLICSGELAQQMINESDDDDDDTPAHKRLREALRGEVPEDKLEDAVVLAYDMGCRDAAELSDDDMDEIHEQFGEA